MNKEEKLYNYYQKKEVLPTYARFSRAEELNKYREQRKEFFTGKLYLPFLMFKGADLIEFGPDSGENSLVFAGWGASVTLVEPNPKARPFISKYFEAFNLKDKLVAIESSDLESFRTDKKFDFIIAEGFIYTIQPESSWIKLFAEILKKDGFFVISYMETQGSLIELLHKLIYARGRTVLGKGSRETAWQLFESKWNGLTHTRSFDSWVMDVLDNPFVRLRYFIDPRDLSKKLFAAKFDLYSSWPCYTDTLNVYWHKKILSPEQRFEANLDFISRSCLSFAFGKKMFLSSLSQEEVTQMNELLLGLISSADRLIDNFKANALEGCIGSLNKIKIFLTEGSRLAGSVKDKEEALRLLECLKSILAALKADDFERLTKICNTERVFIDSWGMPCQYAVFRKAG